MQTHVRFVEDESKTLTVLEIRAPLKHPLTEDIERRLTSLAVQVVHSETRMAPRGVELTLHVAERNGSPLTQKRRLELQTLLLSNASPSEVPPKGVSAVHIANDDTSDAKVGPRGATK